MDGLVIRTLLLLNHPIHLGQEGFYLVVGQACGMDHLEDAVNDGLLRFREGWREVFQPGFLRTKVLDHVIEFLPFEYSLWFQHLHQRRGLPHVGESQFFKRNQVFGVKLLSHDGNSIPEWGKSARGGGNSAHEPGAETRRGQAGKGGPNFPDSCNQRLPIAK